MTDEKHTALGGATPRYSHNCPRCIFLGQHEEADLYACPDHRGYEYSETPEVIFIARYANGTWTAYPRDALSPGLSHHTEAARRWDLRETAWGALRYMKYATPLVSKKSIADPVNVSKWIAEHELYYFRCDVDGNLLGWRCPLCRAINNPLLAQCPCGGETPEEKKP